MTLEGLPNFDFVFAGAATRDFLSLGPIDFRGAVIHVLRLPHDRNSNRADFNLIFRERRGTCSTKHAALAQVAFEQKQPVFLTFGIYEMNGQNTPVVAAVLDEFGLETFPEAHCYLTHAKNRIDVTRCSCGGERIEPIENLLYEETIRPDQIGEYKLRLHRTFFRDWMRERNLAERFAFDELWNIREKCVAALAQTA